MPFMSKEEIESEAQRLGVDLTGLTWPQQQRAIMDAQGEEKDLLLSQEKNLEESFMPSMPWEQTKKSINDYSVEELENLLAKKKEKENRGIDIDGDKDLINTETHFNPDAIENKREVIVDKEIIEDVVAQDQTIADPMEEMRGRRVMIAPEMAQTATQLFGIDEDLGEEVAVEEIHHDIDTAMTYTKDMVTGTYKVLGKTGRHVVAQTAMPKEGCGITFRPDQDIVPIVTWQGRRGYLWTHQRLPNIKDLLKQSGYYEQYKDQFRDEPNIWHAATKLLVCDIGLTDHILAEIEADAKRKLVDKARTDEFLTRS